MQAMHETMHKKKKNPHKEHKKTSHTNPKPNDKNKHKRTEPPKKPTIMKTTQAK